MCDIIVPNERKETEKVFKKNILYIKPVDIYLERVNYYYEKHNTFHVGDSGLDLFCLRDVTIPAKAISFKVSLGICCNAVLETHNCSRCYVNTLDLAFHLAPRSSLGARSPIRLSNGIGLIDRTYRGELIAFVDNISDKDFDFVLGERYFQIYLPSLESFDTIKIVNELSTTSRGDGGFGSTNADTASNNSHISTLANAISNAIDTNNIMVSHGVGAYQGIKCDCCNK